MLVNINLSSHGICCDCLFIEACDFLSFPTGGQLSFAKMMMATYGNRLALVGVCTDNTPVGRWVVKSFDGIDYLFFGFLKVSPSIVEKPLIPFRITTSAAFCFHSKAILALGLRNVFLQAPELLMVISKWPLKSICFMFPGVDNPMETSRYKYGKLFSPIFDYFFFRALKKVEILLACADRESIQELVERSRGKIMSEKVIQFPTRVDTSLFYPLPPIDKKKAKHKFGYLSEDVPVYVVCGRINVNKGWKLLVDSFLCYTKRYGDAHLVFIGDGEDRKALEAYITKLNLQVQISITGRVTAREIVTYMNTSAALLVGSVVEGWSLAMLEALACGIPVVSTVVSGARDMICEGKNGYLVLKRNPELFADYMHKVLSVSMAAVDIAREIEMTYSLKTLRRELSALWYPLA